MRNERSHLVGAAAVAFVALLLASTADAADPAKKDSKKEHVDPYVSYVWPPPPDEARIRLVDIVSKKTDVEGDSKLTRALIGARPNPFDRLKRPMGVAFDREGRLLVADSGLAALVRFDKKGKRYDVFGTTGGSKLTLPLSVSVAPDGTIYVADGSSARVVAFDGDGDIVKVYGRPGELVNPADAEVSPDGKHLYVADTKGNQVVVFDRASAAVTSRIGSRGEAPGEFNAPSALAFDADGTLFVVDQMNARVQLLSKAGEFLEQLGGRGTSFGQFTRPKGVAIDDHGYILVTDAAFNNVQIFDSELRLLTFVGGGGSGPGGFQLTGGVATQGDRFAVADQLGQRVQIFQYVSQPTTPRSEQNR